MADLVLTTLNARFAHTAFGLRYLLANLAELGSRARILEFEVGRRTTDILEALLAESPRIVGIGVYVWNARESRELVAALKRVRPEVLVVLGGPEVSHEIEAQEIVALADHVIPGEADLAFAELCQELLRGERPPKVVQHPLPDLRALALPYALYDARDLAHRVTYVEASRGCPFECEFCLSALDESVRAFPLPALLGALDQLLQRGASHFKFVDRTFNLSPRHSAAVLQFFLERLRPGLLLHFEMIPDHLPEVLRALLQRFPPGVLQLEVGIQTLDPAVAARIRRRMDVAAIARNLRFLREHTHAHVHADLIVGLPGEDLATFGRGFDQLCRLDPQEIQVGILKRLRGAPIVRHGQEWGLVWSPDPPYEILATRVLSFAEVQRMRRFARYLDLIANSGQLPETARELLAGPAPFAEFLALSDWLWQRARRAHAIALPALAEFLHDWLVAERGRDRNAVAAMLWRDWQRGGRKDPPAFLRDRIPQGRRADARRPNARAPLARAALRQARHLTSAPKPEAQA